MDFINGDSIYSHYIDFINKAISDEETFRTFKSNVRYTGILEHVSEEQGHGYLQEINKYPRVSDDLWVKFLENDNIGSPHKFKYNLPIGVHAVSPTTLRYVKFALDIFYTKMANKENLNIVEIGGGYGGLCKILFDIASDKISSYTILDLDSVSKLSRKYLENFDCKDKVKTGTLNDYNFDKIDLVLAFYSYSELSEDFRKLYSKEIISKSESGFMCWNINLDNDLIKKELNKNTLFFHEIPLTGQYNRIVMF